MTLPRLRRLSQTLFLGLFLVLLWKTELRGSFQPGAVEFRLPPAVRAFLETDPLVAITNALATRALYHGLIWSLAILIPTLFLGRFFCGWICPLGTLNHLVSDIRSERKSGRQRIASNRYQPWQRFKYYLLFALLAAAFLGGALVGILDPIALTVRSFALSILPAGNYALNALSGHGHTLLPAAFLSFKQAHFRQGFLLGVIFIAILALNLRITRFWCRAVCPLGALLGLFSRWSILGLVKQPAHCEDCNRCLLHCQGGDDPIPGARWRKAECHLCMNCVADCPESGIQFRFFPPAAGSGTIEGADLRRRKVLTGLAAGAVAIPLLRANTGLSAEPHERLIRPPGALDEKLFLARCVRCGECMKVCLKSALYPAAWQAGIEGIYTPLVVPRLGYCEYNCTLCGQVCPTGAIPRLPVDTKQREVIGKAVLDKNHCLPFAKKIDCIVCEEHCPIPTKAIRSREVETLGLDGRLKKVKEPYVVEEICNGCGICENVCPLETKAGIEVFAVKDRTPIAEGPVGETQDGSGLGYQ